MQNFCSNCGKKLNQDSNYCPNCGNLLKNENIDNNLKNEITQSNGNLNSSVMKKNDSLNYPNNGIDEENNKTNTCAIIGFVLSLCCFTTCGLTSILGLIFSIIGTVTSKKYGSKGKGFSIAGIIISSVFIIVLALLFILILIGSNELSSVETPNFYGPMY